MELSNRPSLFNPFSGKDIWVLASALAYSTVLSIIPFLILSFSIFHLLGGTDLAADRLRPVILNYLTVGAGDKLLNSLTEILASVPGTGLGLIGYLMLTFVSLRLVGEVDSTIQRIWKAPSLKFSLKRNLFYLLFIFLCIPGVAVLLGLLFIELDRGNLFLSLPDASSVVVVSFLLLIFIFKYTPPKSVASGHAALGAGGVTLGWYALAVIYNESLRTFFSAGTIYGSLAFIPMFLFWMFLIWYVFLLGVALVHALHEHNLGEGFYHFVKALAKQMKTLRRKLFVTIKNI